MLLIKRLLLGFVIAANFCFPQWSMGGESQNEIKIGSKKFTESVILGEMAYHLINKKGVTAVHKAELGGTQILFKSLVQGELDIYPEYTGTIVQEIFSGELFRNEEEVRDKLESMGILMSKPIGFNNSYIIGMKKEAAIKFGIDKISDLKNHPELKFGFSNEFMDRGDGWPSLQRKYNLPQRDVRGIDHDIGYRGLENGSIDVIDLYSTDAEIDYYDLKSLIDDLNHFPEYQAVFLYRSDFAMRNPESVKSLLRLEGMISESDMVKLNADVKLAGKSEGEVASKFLERKLKVKTEFYQMTIIEKLIRDTYDHLFLVVISLSAAIIIAIPLGIFAYKTAKFGQLLLGTIGVIQTIPSLALIVFMIPLLGIGAKPAIAALFLYSLLPIVRNTYSGLKDIPLQLSESAEALGLPSRVKMIKIELPLASRSILSGIKTAAVINVGTATLGAIIGAGGYGQPILTGIRLDDTGLILQGAIPAALLAFGVQWLFEMLEPIFVSKGLRLGE